MSAVQSTALASESNAVRAWIAKWPAVSFYVLTLTLSWGYWLTLLAQGRRVVPGSVVTHFPGLMGPMLTAMAVTAVIGGRKALHELFGRVLRLGPCWTSSVMPAHGRLRATLWVELLWSLWHAPLFWLNAGMAALVGPVLIGWLFALVCGAFVLAQVYLATGHGILCVSLWTAGYNMMVATEIGTGFPAAIVGTAVMAGSLSWPCVGGEDRLTRQGLTRGAIR